MSVQSEITRLETAKAAIKTAIEGKGVTVPDATMLDGMPELIDAIEAGADTSVEDAIITRTISGEYTNSRVTKVGNRAFFGCVELTAVSFPLATTIVNGAFSGSALTSVDFPKVTTIEEYAFQYCSKLTSVDFPKATIIRDYAFQYCYALTSANFPKVTGIRANAFQYCSELTTVDIPLTTSIGSYAFGSCSNLSTVSFPQARSIDSCAFQNCSMLTSVDLPLTTSIDSYVFEKCSKLTALVLRNTTKVCSLASSSTFYNTPIKSGTGYIYVPDDLVDSYKAATNWAVYAAQIKPLSEYTGG